MEKLLQGETTTTIPVNINNDDDAGINKIHEYHDWGGGVEISYNYATEEITSILDRRN